MTTPNQESEPTFLENMASGVAKKAAESLVDELEARVQKLFFQKQLIQERQSNYDIIIKRYYTDTSILDGVSGYYGNLPLWEKILIFVGIVAGSALIGAIFNFAAVAAVISFVILSAFTYVLHDHQSKSEERRERLCKDIQAMELELKEETGELIELESGLKEVFANLSKAQGLLNTKNVELEHSLSNLRIQIE